MTLFVSFEGGEGSGKTTQVGILLRRLEESGHSAVRLREPGMTPLGNAAREWLKRSRPKEKPLTEGAELLLFAASRAEMVAKLLKPALETHVVVSDRYADSTTAYQGYGRRLSIDLVNATNELATNGLMPHKTFLLDLTPEEGLRRAGSDKRELFDTDHDGRLDEEGSRRFEEEPRAFHERVRKGYLTLAESEPDRWAIVDASQHEDSVFESIWGHLQSLDEFQEMLAPVEYTEGIKSDTLQQSLFPVADRNSS